MQNDKSQEEKDQSLRDNAGSKNPFNTTSQPVISEEEKAEQDAEAEQERKEALTERD